MNDPPETGDPAAANATAIGASSTNATTTTVTGLPDPPVVRTLDRQWHPGLIGGTLLVAVFAAVAAFSLLLYVTERTRTAVAWRVGLWTIRVAVLVLIGWMLFGWFFERRVTDRPDLIVAIDVSQSMGTADGTVANASGPTATPTDTPSFRPAPPTSTALTISRLDRATSFLAGRGATGETAASVGVLPALEGRYRVRVSAIGEVARPVGRDVVTTLAADAVTPDANAAAGTADAASPSSLSNLRLTDSVSRLADNLRNLLDGRRGRPTAAVVILTDGIVTEGIDWDDLVAVANDRQAPLFFVGFGSDQPRRDAALARVMAEPGVFLGDTLTVEVVIRTTGLAGRTLRLAARRGVSPAAPSKPTTSPPGSDDGLDSLSPSANEDDSPPDENETKPPPSSPADPRDGEILAEETMAVAVDGEERTVRLTFRPDREGEFPYHVTVEPANVAAAPGQNPFDEETLDNNVRNMTVTVRNDTLRVLLVQGGPSWEYRHLKTLLERTIKPDGSGEKAFDLVTVLQDADLDYVATDATSRQLPPAGRDELLRFDAIVISDADPGNLGVAWMGQVASFVTDSGGGLLLLPGPDHLPTDYAGTPLEPLFPYEARRAVRPGPGAETITTPVAPTTIGLTLPALQLGPSPLESRTRWAALPSLRWLMNGIEPRPAARTLLETTSVRDAAGRPRPVVLTQFAGAGRVVAHTTDETWVWRSRLDGADYETYWLQMTRFLCRGRLAGGSGRVDLTVDREEIRVGEPASVRVRWLDEPSAPEADDGAVIVVEQADGQTREVRLTREAATRSLFVGDVNGLPVGTHRVYLASPLVPGTPPSAVITVTPPPGELARLAMRRQAMTIAARATGGQFFGPDQADALLAALPSGEGVPIRTLDEEPLWNRWPLIAAVLLLLTAEWTLRRVAGLF